jgi:CTP:molybdopterin cytidylyltransferase MocA
MQSRNADTQRTSAAKMKLLNAKNTKQNIAAPLARSGKSLMNAVLLGNSPNDAHASLAELHNTDATNVIQSSDFDQGSSDSLFAGLNGITTEQQHKLNSFDAIHYFATSTIAANDAGGVL